MKLQIIDGVVVCSLDDKNKDYLMACRMCGVYDGYYGTGYLKMSKPCNCRNEEAEVIAYSGMLSRVLKLSQEYDIEIAPEVYTEIETYQAATQSIERRWAVQEAKYSKCEHWLHICEHGCDGCRYLCRAADDYMCAYTRELLPEKNCPENGYLFVYRAFPSDNCPYKAEPITDEAEYAEYKARTIMEQF